MKKRYKSIKVLLTLSFIFMLIGVGRQALTSSFVWANEQAPLAEEIRIWIVGGANVDGANVFYEGINKNCVVDFYPVDCEEEEIKWTSTNPNIAEVDKDGKMSFYAPGKTTITVTSERGLTDSVDITVLELPEIKLGVEKTLNDYLMSERGYWYKFTPEKTGLYCFYLINSEDEGDIGYCTGHIEEMNDVTTTNGILGYRFSDYCELVEGKTYILYANAYDTVESNSDEVYKVQIDEVTDTAERMEIKTGSHNMIRYIGGSDIIDIEYFPQRCLIPESNITWTSSNPKVVSCESGGFAWLKYLSEGSATITAENEHGLKDSVVIEVKSIEEMPEVELDILNRIKIEYDEDVFEHLFVAEESGTYVLDVIGGSGNVENTRTKEYIFTDWESYGDRTERAVFELEEGDMCKITSYSDSYCMSNYSFKISKYDGTSSEYLAKGYFAYKILNDSEVLLYSYQGKDNQVTIPDKADNFPQYKVVGIADNAFSSTPNVTSITIPDSVEYIPEDAFDGLNEVVLRCYEGAAAQTFAEHQGIPFEIIKRVTRGDIDNNEMINAADALLVLKHAASLFTIEDEQTADVNQDGMINAADALIILKYAANIIDEI